MSDNKLDNLELSEDELNKIREATEKEYAELGYNKSNNKLLVKILALGILVLLVLVIKTIADTKDTIRDVKTSKDVIEVEIDNNGKITSKQSINIGDY